MDLMIRSIISHFFPNSCLACEKEIDPGYYLCSECLNSMAGPIMAPLELPYIDSAFSYWKYESPMRELIHAYKFEDRPGIARLFSNMTFEMMNTFLPATNVVVPVPTSLQAFVKRGYDTNLGILRFLSRKVEIRIENILSISGKTVPQSTLKMKDRIDNVKDKFRLKKKPSCDSVILFDDVVTSGATASQCARVLREGGVKDIVFFTVASAKK